MSRRRKPRAFLGRNRLAARDQHPVCSQYRQGQSHVAKIRADEDVVRQRTPAVAPMRDRKPRRRERCGGRNQHLCGSVSREASIHARNTEPVAENSISAVIRCHSPYSPVSSAGLGSFQVDVLLGSHRINSPGLAACDSMETPYPPNAPDTWEFAVSGVYMSTQK